MALSWQEIEDTPTGQDAPFPELCRKILLVATSDAQVVSRLRPMLEVLETCAEEVVVVTRSTRRLREVEALGARVIDLDEDRALNSPAGKAAAVWRLARIVEAEAPDVVHLVGTRPIVLGGLAFRLMAPPHVVIHVAGPGPLGVPMGPMSRVYRSAALHLTGSMLRKLPCTLLAENPSDLTQLRLEGIDPGGHFALLGGMGVDPLEFPALPPPGNAVPVAAFVGRVTRSNGVDLLIQACDRVAGRGLKMSLELCGGASSADADAVDREALVAWCARGGGRWVGPVEDTRAVWHRADICVLPARHGGGMPRALLEAAACARPLVVTDVAGCSDFVRNGVEGIVVPPDDPAALAEALQRLARDPDLRERMGEAARLRLLHGYTHTHLREVLRSAYQALLNRRVMH